MTKADARTTTHTLPNITTHQNREYEVRRYPAFEAVETNYENRPEGYDRLGTYASGWNVEVQFVCY